MIITEKAVGDYMVNIDPGRLKWCWRLWTLELLKVVEYLQANEITPLDLSLENLVYSSNGSVAIEDCLFTFDKNEAMLALYADETCDSSDELADMKLLDSLHIGMILLRVFLQETYPTNIGELLILLKSGAISRKLDDITDPKVRKFLSCCICDISHRWSIAKMLEHPILKEEIGSEREDFTDSLTSRSSEESSELPPMSKTVSVEMTISMNEAKLRVQFWYDLRKDTPEKVSEELLAELNVNRMFLPQTVEVIRRKVGEKVRKTEDLITLSPQQHPSLPPSHTYSHSHVMEDLSTSHMGSSFPRPQNESNDPSDLPKLDQSCPSLLDIVRKGKTAAASEDTKAAGVQQDVTTVIYLKKGAENDELKVKRLQEALNLVQNSDLYVDGVFSKKTEQVVKAFQETEGLEVTGIVESATWSALTLHYQRLKPTAV